MGDEAEAPECVCSRGRQGFFCIMAALGTHRKHRRKTNPQRTEPS